MFTGLIQDIGVVEELQRGGEAAKLRLATRLADRLRDGDSLAVNGVCLTVTGGGEGKDRVTAVAVAETLDLTTLGDLRRGDRVHLEPALCVGDPMGGHIVQGHVDGTGTIAEAMQRGVALELTIKAPAKVIRYLVQKGSVAIDGASLTVARLADDDDNFTVALVPHTLTHTTFEQRRAGERVNLETDVLAKYVERMLSWTSDGEKKGKDIDIEWLRERGFA